MYNKKNIYIYIVHKSNEYEKTIIILINVLILVFVH